VTGVQTCALPISGPKKLELKKEIKVNDNDFEEF
jgi:hypothetical protein